MNKAGLTDVKDERQTDEQKREKRERKIVPCQQWSKCMIRVSRKL